MKTYLFLCTRFAAGVALLLSLASLLISCGKPILNAGPGSRDFSKHLAGDYYIIRTSPNEIGISPTGYNPDTTPVIPSTVQACDTDGHWIIAKTITTAGESLQASCERESYWILDLTKKSLHGPLSLAKFTQTRQLLGVPKELELRDVLTF